MTTARARQPVRAALLAALAVAGLRADRAEAAPPPATLHGIAAAPTDDRAAFARALPIFQNAAPTPRHWRRMLGEAAALFGAMQLYYWGFIGDSQPDLVYRADGHNLRARFITFDAWRFDDNAFATNAARHPAEGMGFYMFARHNGFGRLPSYAIGVAMSTTWEVLAEYRENVSINDLIITPTAGFPIGEGFAQLGAFLLRSRGGWAHAIGTTLTGGRGLLDRVDRNPAIEADRLDAHGLDATVGHHVGAELDGGYLVAPTGAQPVLRAGLDSDLVMIPGLGQPGAIDHALTDGGASRLTLASTWGRHGLIDVDFRARAMLIGRYRKRVAPDGDGYELLAGLSSAFTYDLHRSPGHASPSTEDRIAIAHVVGPTVDVIVHRGLLEVRAAADVSVDFALLRNLALDARRAQDPALAVRSTVARDNYYDGIGVSATARVLARCGAVAGGIEVGHDLVTSLQGRDRHGDVAGDDYALTDTRTTGRAWLSIGLRPGPDAMVRLQLSAELRHRTGAVLGLTERADARTYLAGLLLEL